MDLSTATTASPLQRALESETSPKSGRPLAMDLLLDSMNPADADALREAMLCGTVSVPGIVRALATIGVEMTENKVRRWVRRYATSSEEHQGWARCPRP